MSNALSEFEVWFQYDQPHPEAFLAILWFAPAFPDGPLNPDSLCVTAKRVDSTYEFFVFPNHILEDLKNCMYQIPAEFGKWYWVRKLV